uniref:Uncharacterized protein n=1 Tax=Pavo cristatus TaxID=9049 RepID=A0A8C9FI16_PAVCR
LAANRINKQDIGAIFKRLRSVPTNKVRAPGHGAVGAAFRRCDTSHWRGAGSTELDSNWSWFQLRCMQVGGNANAVCILLS